MASRFRVFDQQIKELLSEPNNLGCIEIAKKILNTTDSKRKNTEVSSLGRYINRNKKHFLDQHEGIYNATNEVDVANRDVKHMWIKTKNVSSFVPNPNYQPKEVLLFENLSNQLIEDLKNYSPKFTKLKRINNNNSHCLVVDPADIHIGKLCSSFETGENYNNQIAVNRVLEGVKGLLNKTSSFSIDKIVFIGGNDILHVDNAKRTTTSGTPQDTDGMWYDNFIIAKQLYIDVLEILISVADVHFVFNPSNHDYMSGFFLADVIQTYFKNCKNITFDCSIAHRKSFQYGKNLIGTTHGDGAKNQDLPLLMATEFPLEWSQTKHRYVYTHHVHHKTSKDYIGVTVESLRSPSGTDSWHHRNGYQHAPKAVEGFLHDKEFGQIARITHIFSLLFIFFSYITV